MIFWIGFFVMVFNEGFVIMRHQSKFFAQLRDELIKDFGDGWQYFNGFIDYAWVIIVTLGFALSPDRLFHLLVFTTFWSAALCLIYIPMWLKTFLAKKYPEKFSGF